MTDERYTILIPREMATNGAHKPVAVAQPERDGVVETHKIGVSEEKAREIAAQAVEKYKSRQKKKKKREEKRKKIADLESRIALPDDVAAALAKGQRVEHIPGDVRRASEPRRRRVNTRPLYTALGADHSTVLDPEAFAAAVDAPKTYGPVRRAWRAFWGKK